MRQPDPELVAEILGAFRRRCADAGTWVSGDGRIGEPAAAALLGWNPASLTNRRSEGTGPPFYRLAGGGNRVTYSLADLAHWVARHREDR